MSKVYADATPKSVGIYHAKKDKVKIALNIPTEQNSILYNELLAVLIAIKYAHTIKMKWVKVFTDNIVAYKILCKEIEPNTPEVRELVKEIFYQLYKAPTQAWKITIFWTLGKDNKADVVSRKVKTDNWHDHLFIYQ